MGFRRPMMQRRFRGNNSFIRAPKKQIQTSYISAGSNVNVLSFATTVAVGLLISADSPDKTIITNLSSTTAQVENNSRVIKRGSFLKIDLAATVDYTPVSIWIYRNWRGMVTSPTSDNDFHTGVQTEDNAQLRKFTIFYWRGMIHVNTPRTMRIPLFSKRNNIISDTSTLVFRMANNQLAAGNVNWHAYGRIRTVTG